MRIFLALLLLVLSIDSIAAPICKTDVPGNDGATSEAARLYGDFAMLECNKNLAKECYRFAQMKDPSNLLAKERTAALDENFILMSNSYKRVGDEMRDPIDKLRQYGLALLCNKDNISVITILQKAFIFERVD